MICDRIERENLTREEVRALWRANALVRTQSRLARVQFLFPADLASSGDSGLYRCLGCETVCEWSNGGSDDVRCDECVVGEGGEL